MALEIGSIEVNEEGGYTGSGLTKRLVDARVATADMAALLSSEGLTAAQKAAFITSLAADCEAMATAIIDEIVTNAEVTVTVSTGDAGLQRIPASTVENTPCKAPSSPVVLAAKATVA